MHEASPHFRAHYPGSKLRLGADVLRSVAELALVSRRLRGISVQSLIGGEQSPDGPASAVKTTVPDPTLAERLAYVIPRVGRRLPWRADCLVQALAAKRWLAAAGIEGQLHIGSRKDGQGKFEAHAWLTVGDLIVTGWDIAGLDQFAEFPLRTVAG